MDYFDSQNIPETALRYYDINGGSVYPDLSHGVLFRVLADQSFTLERLRNQIDGAKFFLEVYNQSGGNITISFDGDYKNTALDDVSSKALGNGSTVTYEIICRIGYMLMYNKTGVSLEGYLLNPLDGSVIRNPLTSEPLLNPG